MEKNEKPEVKPNAGTMLSQKTNEDFNKKKPDPENPHEHKGEPDNTAPIVAYDDKDEDPNKASDATTDPKNVTYKNNGSE